VLELYDREVRPASTDDLLDISNAVSLLWRLEQARVDVGARWEELADCSQAHIDDHLLTFGDVHYLIAVAAAGRTEDSVRLLDSLSQYAASSDESEHLVAQEPGLALARAVLAEATTPRRCASLLRCTTKSGGLAAVMRSAICSRRC
jgi:hypothetical protein